MAVIRRDVLIIGAGAAGLMCARTLAAYGQAVTVVDHADQPGKKIRISGGGRCNFTNRYASAAHYISENPHFCKSALARYSAADFIAEVEAHGIAYHERDHGQLFCNDSAQAIIDMLEQGCRSGDVQFALKRQVVELRREESGMFHLQTAQEVFQAPAVVIATGGLSIPKIGASSLGMKLAAQFDCPVVPPRAGLVPLTFSDGMAASLKHLAGIALPVEVSCRGQRFREAMLFTHRGISGPAILQISSYWLPGDTIEVNVLPDDDAAAWLAAQRVERPDAHISNALARLLPKRLAHYLCDAAYAGRTLKSLTPPQLQSLAAQLHGWQLKPSATEGYRTAEVTLGGVSTGVLSSSTMMVKHVPGLYFVGEVVDVSGQLGGFNFQWAWSSAYCAAMAIVESAVGG